MAIGEQDSREWLLRAEGVLAQGIRMPKRDTGKASTAELLRWMWAWIDAAIAYGVTYEGGGLAQFESRWLKIQDQVAKRDDEIDWVVERYLPPHLDPKLRELFKLPTNQVHARLLGEHEESGRFLTGIALLTEPEYTALTLALEPIVEEWTDEISGYQQVQLRMRDVQEIARDMTSRRHRSQFGRSGWVKVETVERYLRGARAKLRVLFWADTSEEEDDDE